MADQNGYCGRVFFSGVHKVPYIINNHINLSELGQQLRFLDTPCLTASFHFFVSQFLARAELRILPKLGHDLGRCSFFFPDHGRGMYFKLT